ncbi:MAG: NRDE family protein [Gelidibacter sp.]|nr:NRDE family protein [Gelidibacter sp.]
MCTVTFLPLTNTDFILTSNRDEQRLRETLHPKIYEEDGIEMLFPKDKVAGGTWVGVSSKKRLVCILNGGFIKHKRKENYIKSRGLIAIELLKENAILSYLENLDLLEVEPFTMIIVDWNNNELHLVELVWDAHEKHITKHKNKPKIWSSSTLYTNENKEFRNKWFQQWLGENEFTSEAILQFHHTETADKEQSILMKRTYVETVSVTSVKKIENTVEMTYEDVVHAKKTVQNLTQI